ncbi:hypothetical protein TNCV_4897291 [Trichonephila clavipes]|nr:hypothetical protein TNCV_4897291 [Trichonephila clavipes]
MATTEDVSRVSRLATLSPLMTNVISPRKHREGSRIKVGGIEKIVKSRSESVHLTPTYIFDWTMILAAPQKIGVLFLSTNFVTTRRGFEHIESLALIIVLNALVSNLLIRQPQSGRLPPFNESFPLDLILRSATTGRSHYAFHLGSTFNHHLAYSTTST